jgi:restriction system protein
MAIFKYKFDDLIEPCFESLKKLGGSATVSEIEQAVIRDLKIPQDQIDFPHSDGSRKLDYNLRWARNYLKRIGIIENSARGVWALTAEGQKANKIDKADVVKQVRLLGKSKPNEKETKGVPQNEEDQVLFNEHAWEQHLLNIIKGLSPSGFERLSQRLLRELGFEEVKVTGKVGDGGIDGYGLLTIGSVITFKIAFQCKRYDGAVPVEKIRDFRGSFEGRAQKGLLITTGTFSPAVKQEAHRDGATPIDLMDGTLLVHKLKELRLGVSVEAVERVSIAKDFFDPYME